MIQLALKNVILVCNFFWLSYEESLLSRLKWEINTRWIMIENVVNFIPGGSEWIIVIVAAGVLLFGAKKIPELAKTFGKAKGEYKKGEIEADKELKEFKESKD